MENSTSKLELEEKYEQFWISYGVLIGILIILIGLTIISVFWQPRAHKLYFYVYMLLLAARLTAPSDYGRYWYSYVG